MRPEELSMQLRESDSPIIERRREVIGLGMVAAGAMGLIVLYQPGIIKHLPEPPLPRLNADEVDASAEAHEKLSMPDAVLGLGSYAATVALAATGGEDRAIKHPWILLALAAKVGLDVAQAAKLAGF